MPDKPILAAPAAPVAPAKPAIAAAPAVAAKPTAAPARPSTIPTQKPKPKLSAKKALGMDETPRKQVEAVTKTQREKMQRTQPAIEFTEPTETPAAPVVTAPDAPIETPAAPVAAAPAAPVTPAKIKVGGKEYTPEELEAALAEGKPAPAPAAAAAAPAAPVEEQPAELTPEEIAKKESEFVQSTAAQIDAPMTEADIDVILAGGKEAIAKMQDIRRRDMATSIMLTRKAIAQGLNPVMNEVFAALKPLIDNHQQLQRYTVEQQFVAKYKDVVPHIETARSIAEELLRRYPEQVAKLSPDQFIDEVYRQTDLHLSREHKRWFPTGDGNWRTLAPAPAAPAAPAQAAPAAPVVAAAPAAAAPAPRVVRAPAANVPSGVAAGGTPDWKKSVAQSLR